MWSFWPECQWWLRQIGNYRLIMISVWFRTVGMSVLGMQITGIVSHCICIILLSRTYLHAPAAESRNHTTLTSAVRVFLWLVGIILYSYFKINYIYLFIYLFISNSVTMTSLPSTMFSITAAMLWVYTVQGKRDKITRVLPCLLTARLELQNNP